MSIVVPVTYPSVIARACAAIDESPVFRDLPDGYFRVVVRIIKKLSIARPTAPIVASRSTLAAESGKSVETVQRVVKWLEDRGLVRREQKARAGLRGSSSPLIPTKALLDALLLSPDTAPARQEPLSYPQDVTLSDVSTDVSISRVLPLSSPSEDSRRAGAFTQVDHVKIPSDLVWLVTSQGLKATGVLALMRLAKAAKQRLSDVVSTTRRYLEGLRGRELFAYLRALLGKDRDYSWQVQDAAIAQQERIEQERIARKSLELEGRQFRTRDGKVSVTVESSGILTEIRDGRLTSRPMDKVFVDALDGGRLLPVRHDDEF
jgi:hypothetical protein